MQFHLRDPTHNFTKGILEEYAEVFVMKHTFNLLYSLRH